MYGRLVPDDGSAENCPNNQTGWFLLSTLISAGKKISSHFFKTLVELFPN